MITAELIAEAQRYRSRGLASDWVSHASYGEGRVVNRLPSDKLEIEFGSHGRKILLARFVKPA
jgi:hypothetical protein